MTMKSEVPLTKYSETFLPRAKWSTKNDSRNSLLPHTIARKASRRQRSELSNREVKRGEVVGWKQAKPSRRWRHVVETSGALEDQVVNLELPAALMVLDSFLWPTKLAIGEHCDGGRPLLLLLIYSK